MIEKIVTGALLTNTYIISSGNQCVIVDPGLGFARAAEEIKAKYDVVAILLTHGHVDHIDGIRYFNCPIYIHEAEVPFLYDDRLSLYSMMKQTTPYKPGSLEIRPVQDRDKLALIGYEFIVLHTPGHTKGSVCYYYSHKLLSGDTLFNGSAGRTDFPTGDRMSLRKSLSAIVAFCDDHVDVYPGHDEKTNIKNERKNNPFVMH